MAKKILKMCSTNFFAVTALQSEINYFSQNGYSIDLVCSTDNHSRTVKGCKLINLDIKSAAKAFDCNYQQINLNQYKKLDTIINQLDTNDKNINLVEIMVDSEKHHSNNKELEGKIKTLFN